MFLSFQFNIHVHAYWVSKGLDVWYDMHSLTPDTDFAAVWFHLLYRK
jgi:hypothetical protein